MINKMSEQTEKTFYWGLILAFGITLPVHVFLQINYHHYVPLSR